MPRHMRFPYAYKEASAIASLEKENAKLRELLKRTQDVEFATFKKYVQMESENAKLRMQLESLQPIDCGGNDLGIADTVHMLRSEYDGDHEWDDVVVELVLTKWGGDRWIVRGSKGEAWACDCLRTGYDEDAYEGSDDAEPIVNPTLIEAENAKLRKLADAVKEFVEDIHCEDCPCRRDCDDNNHIFCAYDFSYHAFADMRELVIEG